MIKTSELRQIKDILKALIMSSVLGNLTKCTSAVLYTKNVGWGRGGGGAGKLLPKLLQKLQKSLRSQCAERSQAWRSHCSEICEAIPFDFFTDSGNLTLIKRNCQQSGTPLLWVRAPFLARVCVTRGQPHNISPQTSHSRKNLCHLEQHFALLSQEICTYDQYSNMCTNIAGAVLRAGVTSFLGPLHAYIFLSFIFQGLLEILWVITLDLRFQLKIAIMIKPQTTVLRPLKGGGGLTAV